MKRALVSFVLVSLSAMADAKGFAVHVLVDFPDREDLDIAVTYEEVYELTGVKQPYKIKFWVVGACAKAALNCELAKVSGEESVVSIRGVSNDMNSHWVYFVDGIRSRYHINTQVAPQLRSIRFKYEKK